MSHIDAALRDFNSLDALAARTTALSALDPRAKILATLGFIVAVVSFDRYAVAALIPFALFPVLLAAVGDIPLRMIARKVLLASPFAFLMGMFNPLFDPNPLLELFGFAVAGGWVSFAAILLRFALTVAAAVVLVGSTGLHQVCAGLRALRVPQVFTTQLLFLHRYAQVLAGEAARMSLARELRSPGGARLPLRVYGSLLGHLLLRAMERAQRIYQAMVARGFDGQLRSIRPLRWRLVDSVFLVLCWSSFVLARQVDLAHLLGKLLMGNSL